MRFILKPFALRVDPSQLVHKLLNVFRRKKNNSYTPGATEAVVMVMGGTVSASTATATSAGGDFISLSTT